MRNFSLKLVSAALAAFMAMGPVAEAAQPSSGNATITGTYQTYFPILEGQTDNPTATYSTQVGWFYQIGNMVWVSFKLVTSGTTTKTTTSDNFAVGLPLPAGTAAGNYQTISCNVENATDVTNSWLGEIASGSQQVTFRNQQPAASSQVVTWATTSPGIGVLSHVITAECSGWYISAY